MASLAHEVVQSPRVPVAPLAIEGEGELGGRRVANLAQDIARLRADCCSKQARIDHHVRGIMQVACLVLAFAVCIIGTIALAPLTGSFAAFLIGLGCGLMAAGILDFVVEAVKSKSYGRAAEALQNEDFVEFATARNIALSADTILDAHKLYLKFQEAQIHQLRERIA